MQTCDRAILGHVSQKKKRNKTNKKKPTLQRPANGGEVGRRKLHTVGDRLHTCKTILK